MKLRRIFALVATLVLVTSLFCAVMAADQVKITVLGTSDLHGRLYSWDYAIDTEDQKSGLVKVATVVKDVKAQNPNTIVVDNGDTIQDNMAELFNNDKVHPMILAMNDIGYSTWTLGNHEFNFGMDLLNRSIKGSKATVIAANIYKENGSRFLKPYRIVKTAGVKVALIGMANPHVPRWEASNPNNFKGLTFTDPITETQKVIAELKGKADVMIGVMHLGEEPEYDVAGSGIKAVAAANPQLTAIISGHAHSDIAGKLINGVLVVEPSANGAKISEIDLTLEKADGKWVVKDRASKNIDVAAVKPDANLLAKFQWVHEKARADVNTVIGKVAGDFLPGMEILPGIPTAQVQDTALVDFINEVQLAVTKADISSAALFVPNSNLVKGDFKKKDVANIYKYTNTLMAVKVTGKQLKAYMEWSAAYYNTSKPGDVTVSFDPTIRIYNYDMFSGVNYDINIAAPVGKRIENLTFKGKPVADDQTFTLAVNNYRYGNMVKDKIFNEKDKIYDSYEALGDKGRIRDLIIDYVQKVGTVTPKCDNNWKITGVDLNHPLKAEVYDKVKSGAIKIPVSTDGRTPNVKSLNVYELCDSGVLNYKIIDILSITDFHGSLVKSGKNIGINSLVGEIKKLKAINKNTIFVGCGDLFQGSAESNLLYGKPVLDALKETGILASAIGNHEYDWGANRIPAWAAEGGFTFLGANIYDKKTNKPVSYVKPYIIVNIGGTKVALIGLTTPETAFKTSPENVKDVEFKDPATTLAQYVKEVKAQGANLAIAVTHLGALQDKSGVITGEAAELGKVDGLDGIFAGHSHEMIVGQSNKVPFVMAYYNGRSLGKLSYIIKKDSNQVAFSQSVLDNLFLRQTTLKDDPATKAIVDKDLVQVQPILSEKIGVSTVELTYNPSVPSLLGELVCEIMQKQTGAQIAIQNGGGLRTPLAKGDLTMGDMYRLMPFDNTLVTAKLTGAQVREAVENGLGNPKISFGQISGLYVTYDLSKPFGQRIVTITLANGEALDPNKVYTVVANDFMFTGGDNYTSLTKGKEIKDTGIPVRDAIRDYIKSLKTISPVYKGYQKSVAPALKQAS